MSVKKKVVTRSDSEIYPGVHRWPDRGRGVSPDLSPTNQTGGNCQPTRSDILIFKTNSKFILHKENLLLSIWQASDGLNFHEKQIVHANVLMLVDVEGNLRFM